MEVLTPARNYQARRAFLPADFKIRSWEDLERYANDLRERPLDSLDELKNWLKDRSELESAITEESRWRYINMTRDTLDPEIKKNYEFFIKEIQPEFTRLWEDLDTRLLENSYSSQLDEQGFALLLKKIEEKKKIFSEENIKLEAEITVKSRRYNELMSGLNVEVNGEEMNLVSASKYLSSTERDLREDVWKKSYEARMTVSEELYDLLIELVNERKVVAANAGCPNFVDYIFRRKERFDYSIEDCIEFHDAVQRVCIPYMKELFDERKNKLGVNDLRPWDLTVDMDAADPLKPYSDKQDFVDKSVKVLNEVDPYFGTAISIMDDLGHLDLETRKGKSPGGYNTCLEEAGVPFIFMNGNGTSRNMRTMFHEAGHAIHGFLTRDMEYRWFKSYSHEIAELASMSMELMTMDHWDIIYPDPEDLKRAKKEQLEGMLTILPRLCLMDRFQHMIYMDESLDRAKIDKIFLELEDYYTPANLDWSGLDDERRIKWQTVLHVFNYPFYMIEYGFAQLGAIAVWRNFKKDRASAIKAYKKALSLGSRVGLPELFEAAEIKFDFSEDYIRELMEFTKAEYDKL